MCSINKLSIFKQAVKDHDVELSKNDFPPVALWFFCLVVYLASVFVSMHTMKLREIMLVNKLILHKLVVNIDFALKYGLFLEVIL